MFRRIVFGILVVMALASAGVDWDAKMVKRGMVEVTRLDPTVAVDLRYATTNNFVGRNMYGTFCKAYLHAVRRRVYPFRHAAGGY